MLASYSNSGQTDLDTHIPSCQFAYRSSKHAATNESPFYMMYLRDLNMPIDLALLPDHTAVTGVPDYVTVMKERLLHAKSVVSDNIKGKQEYYKDYYDKGSKPSNFLVGDQVLIFTPKPRKGLSPKLQRLFVGPYEIVEVMPPNVKVLITGGKKPVTQIIHLNRCRKCQL